MDKRTRQRHQQRKRAICSIKSIRSLCGLLNIDQRRLFLLARKPPYNSFTIPKKEGGERLIETPTPELKRVLRTLNSFLQSVYFFEKSSAAYGFITGVANDDDRRNVVTNARKHLGKKYLLNIDLKDFFHTIKREQVVFIFAEAPFQLRGELPDLLADLTTFHGRLPLGAPTSPTLSNFACRALDAELIAFAKDMLWTFTRYADDMSFSSNQAFPAEKLNSVRSIIEKSGFAVNERKVQLFGPDDEKIVTGLLVGEQVTLAPDYLPKLKAEIEQLQDIMRAQNEQGQLETKWVENLKKQVQGRLNFAGFVLRRNSPAYVELRDAYQQAIHPPQEEFGAINWRAFPYN